MGSQQDLHSDQASSVDVQEIEKFERMAEEWWDDNGKFKPLHQFNPCRIGFIRDALEQDGTAIQGNETGVFEGLKFADIGCGGGLLAVPMHRLGAHVTAIDASEKNIHIANAHANKLGLSIDYQSQTVEDMLKDQANHAAFDVVMAMEIVEHVHDPYSFIGNCSKLVKPGGHLFVATLNRTIKSYLMAIIGAEYVMRWLPKGTHEWKKFLHPHEVAKPVLEQGLDLVQVKGASFNLLTSTWSITDDTSVNYILHAKKPS